MSKLEIRETFEIQAPAQQVWEFLLDPSRIVTCMPGAGLDEIEDERTFQGNVKVKLGPVTMKLKGRAELTEVDEQARRVVMVGSGKDSGGASSVKMEMVGHVVEKTPSTTEVQVHATVDMAGKIVRFGRGMIQAVAGQFFKEFATKLGAKLEAEAPPPAAEDEGFTREEAKSGEQPTRAVGQERGQEQEAISGFSIFFSALFEALFGFVRRILAVFGIAGD